MKIAALTACAIAGLLATMPSAPAQTGAQLRSLDEVKAEVMRRAGRINPFEGVRRDDAEKVLASLTTNPASYFKVAKKGRVEVGLDADLVILEGDPIADVRNLAKVATTIRAGQVIYQKP